MSEGGELRVGVGSLSAELESVQSGARWLIGAASAVVATLLAGLQLSVLTRLTFDTTLQLIVSLVACFVGLASVGVVLVLAARVLIHPGWTLNRLAHLDGPNQKWQRHWLRKELESQYGLIVPGDELRPASLYRRHRRLLEAWLDLTEIGHITLPDDLSEDSPSVTDTHEYHADVPADVERLERRLTNVIATATQVAAVANLAAVRRRYRRLVRCLPFIGSLPIVAILFLVWTAAANTDVQLAAPLGVTVELTTSPPALLEADLPITCAGRKITGVAIGGSLAAPVIVSDDPSCPLHDVRITPTLGLVIPIVPTPKP